MEKTFTKRARKQNRELAKPNKETKKRRRKGNPS
jgi:hypothetical protein